MDNKKKHLFFSIVLDAIGMASFFIPFLGEVGDTIYAPIYGFLIFMMYKKKALPATIGGFVGLVEEFLPATDFIPTATIMWFYTYYISKNK